MSAYKFVANLSELELVCNAMAFNAPSETQGDGVWVASENGGRVWSAVSGVTIWEVVGEPEEFPLETRCLPSRAIWEARILALTSTNHDVEFSIPDDLVCLVNSDVGSSVIDLPRQTQPPTYPIYIAEAASAKVTVGALYDLLFRARLAPAGPSNDEFPDAQLFIENSAISIFVDWSVRNASRCTYRIPAEVSGEGTCSILMGALFDVIREFDRESELVLRIPASQKHPILIESGLFRAAVECAPVGAVQYHDEVLAVLGAMRGCKVQTISPGVFTLTTSNRTFQVELRDSPAETISVHTDVCREMTPTFELLTQVNETNAALVGARLWMVDDVVWAGFDLPVVAHEELSRAIQTLDNQLNGFDVFLSGFSEAR